MSFSNTFHGVLPFAGEPELERPDQTADMPFEHSTGGEYTSPICAPESSSCVSPQPQTESDDLDRPPPNPSPLLDTLSDIDSNIYTETSDYDLEVLPVTRASSPQDEHSSLPPFANYLPSDGHRHGLGLENGSNDDENLCVSYYLGHPGIPTCAATWFAHHYQHPLIRAVSFLPSKHQLITLTRAII
jgi:hypothetical protein